MKTIKKSISIILLLLLVLSTAACGDKSAAESGSSQDQTGTSDAAGDASQNAPDIPDTDDAASLNTPKIPGIGDNSSLYTPNGSGDQNGGDVSGTGSNLPSGTYTLEDLFSGNLDNLYYESFSTVTEFYNSDLRVILEDLLNQLLSGLNEAVGIDLYQRFFLEVEEPGILIYNYQYGEIIDAAYLEAYMETNMDEIILSAQNDIRTFQAYGLPVKVYRMNHLTADGSLACSLDITEDLDPSQLTGSSSLPENPGEGLQEWMDSAEAAETVEAINNLLASTGITVSFTMDGNTLIYQYYLPAGRSFSDFTEEERNAAFDTMVDANTDSVRTIFTLFAEEHGLNLDAVRFVFYSADGIELYSRDVTP